MGGLFVRKLAGASALGVHSQKLFPLLFQPAEAHWANGHFSPMLFTTVVGNLAITGFYAAYADELKGSGADQLSFLTCALLIFESIVILGYAFSSWRNSKAQSSTLPPGKSASSIPCRIVMRTVTIASGMTSVIAIRDLFFPGQIISPIPRDDIYLEWTNAFMHSPPPGSIEDQENGLESALYVGDKFISQYMALHMLILCFQKFTTAFFIRTGKDGSGAIKCRIFWKVQVFSGALVTFMFRLFANSATTASLDLRWHLMLLAYETFIIGEFKILVKIFLLLLR